MGRFGRRFGEHTARSLSFPPFTCGIAEPVELKVRSTSPEISAASASPVPLKGTCIMSTPAWSLKASAAMCWMLPTPDEAKVSLPGFALAYLMRSGTSANLCFGWWHSICGVMPMSAIGVKSLTGSNRPLATSSGPMALELMCASCSV